MTSVKYSIHLITSLSVFLLTFHSNSFEARCLRFFSRVIHLECAFCTIKQTYYNTNLKIFTQLLLAYHRNIVAIVWKFLQTLHSPSIYTLLYVLPVPGGSLWIRYWGPCISMKNPLQFLLRAATIYPHKLAISHPDVESPVCYTYSVWYDFLFSPSF